MLPVKQNLEVKTCILFSNPVLVLVLIISIDNAVDGFHSLFIAFVNYLNLLVKHGISGMNGWPLIWEQVIIFLPSMNQGFFFYGRKRRLVS